MKYSGIKEVDIANGTGVRVSLFVSGCRLNCKNCFNKEAQSFSFGFDYTEETEDYLIELLKRPFIEGLSILGGDPLEPENQKTVLSLLEKVKLKYPDKNVWLWTGRVYEKDLLEGGNVYIPEITNKLLDCVDYLVDGPFIQDLHTKTIKFRGSTNQRILSKEDRRKLNDLSSNRCGEIYNQ